MLHTVARVAVEKTTARFDRLFDYLIPAEMRGCVVPGCRVLVPFGSGSRMRQGMIISLHDKTGEKKLKSLAQQLDETPLLSRELLNVVQRLHDHTLCTW